MVPATDADQPEGGIKAKQKVKVEVSSVDTMDRRVFLNMKNIGSDKEGAAQRQRKALKAQADAMPGTIGDLIKEKLGGKLDLKTGKKGKRAAIVESEDDADDDE